MTKEERVLVSQIFADAAADYGVSIQEVTLEKFLASIKGRVPVRFVRTCGGFVKLKKSIVGKQFPPNPLASEEVKHLHGHALSKYVSEVMKQCATELDIPPHELTWAEFKKFINLRWGKNDRGIADYTISRAGGFPTIRDGYFPPLPTENIVNKQRLREQASMNRRLGSQYSDQQFILDQIETYSDRVFKGSAGPVKDCCLKKKTEPTQRMVVLVLSDLHIGSDLKKEEGTSDFGRIEESRRLASIIKQTASYKLTYRNETELELLLLGDIMQGALHDMRDGAVIAEQIARCIHLLSQSIAYLASHFKAVRIRCATGNHGRNTARHKERAVHQKWDSLESIIYIALRSACSNLHNVKFFIPKTPFVTFPLFNKKVFATHGDTVLNPGNPGKNISISTLEHQTSRINAGLVDREEYSLFIVGHTHCGSVSYLSNGAVMLTNAAMVPPDSFAVSLGIVESQQGQWLFESTPDKVVGDLRFINVGRDEDENSSLDSIIRPWEEF